MSNLTPLEFKNQRIITTKVLAEQFGTEETNIKTNFNRNMDRFTAGKHYFQLIGEELQEFKRVVADSNDPSIKFASVLTLWTDRGAARHAKILETDEAWEVYEQLEETYFRVKDAQQLKPMTQAEILAGQAQLLVDMERKVDTLDTKITTALDVFTTPSTDDWRHEINDNINKMCIDQKLNYQGFRHEIYAELEGNARVDLSSRQGRLKDRMKKAGATCKECSAITKLDIIERDPKLKLIFEGIVRKYQAKYAIG